MNNEIGARLKAKRKEKDITQKAMAAALGVSQPEVSNIEKGKRVLSEGRIAQLMSILGVTKEWILTGQDAPAPTSTPTPTPES